MIEFSNSQLDPVSTVATSRSAANPEPLSLKPSVVERVSQCAPRMTTY